MLPKKAEYVRLRYDRENNVYYADAFSSQIELTALEYAVLRAADGKTELAEAFPKLPEPRLKGLVRELRDSELLVTSRMRGIFIARCTLLRIANRVKPLRGLCGILNLLLPFVSVPLFCVGAVFCDYSAFTLDLHIPLLLALFVLAVTLHEFCHFIAGVAYRYYVIDTGILMVFRFLPIGAYVNFMYDSRKRKKRHNVQFNLAGIEMNLLLSGVCGLLSSVPGPFAGDFICFAFLNLLMSALNLLPAPVLDGGSALAAMFGIDHYSLFIKESLRKLKQLARSGAAGWLCIALALAGAVGMLVLIGLVVWDICLLAGEIISLF